MLKSPNALNLLTQAGINTAPRSRWRPPRYYYAYDGTLIFTAFSQKAALDLIGANETAPPRFPKTEPPPIPQQQRGLWVCGRRQRGSLVTLRLEEVVAILPITCQQWDCPTCGPKKKARLMEELTQAVQRDGIKMACLGTLSFRGLQRKYERHAGYGMARLGFKPSDDNPLEYPDFYDCSKCVSSVGHARLHWWQRLKPLNWKELTVARTRWGQLEWQAYIGALWQRWTQLLMRKVFNGKRIKYLRTIEPTQRMVPHIHFVLLTPTSSKERVHMRYLWTTLALGSEMRGQQIDEADGYGRSSPARAIGYILKYTIKNTDGDSGMRWELPWRRYNMSVDFPRAYMSSVDTFYQKDGSVFQVAEYKRLYGRAYAGWKRTPDPRRYSSELQSDIYTFNPSRTTRFPAHDENSPWMNLVYMNPRARAIDRLRAWDLQQAQSKRSHLAILRIAVSRKSNSLFCEDYPPGLALQFRDGAIKMVAQGGVKP